MAVLPVALSRWRGRQRRRLECAHASAASVPVLPATPHPLLAVRQVAPYARGLAAIRVRELTGKLTSRTAPKAEWLPKSSHRQDIRNTHADPCKHGATPGQHEQHCTETPVRDTCRGGGAAAGDRVRRPGRRWRAESHRRLPTPSCAARVTHARCPGETRSPAVFPPLHTPAPCTHTTSPTAHREKAVGGSHAVSVRRQVKGRK